MRILIVDDNEQVRLLLRDYLSNIFEEVYECSDGGEALNCFTQYRPDWVLMDWEMPNLDGIGAIKNIIARYPQAKICMLTAFDEDEIRSEAFSAGACGFVAKDNMFDLPKIFQLPDSLALSQ